MILNILFLILIPAFMNLFGDSPEWFFYFLLLDLALLISFAGNVKVNKVIEQGKKSLEEEIDTSNE